MLMDYHIHLEHGRLEMDWLRRFVDEAVGKGIAEVGVSEHMFKFYESSSLWPSWWRFKPDRYLSDYVELVSEARAMGIPVKLGVEAEYIEGLEKEIGEFLEGVPWDYVIGSVHFIGDWAFDDTEVRDEWENRDVAEAYRLYFSLLEKAIRCGLYDVIAHPDV
ncbi:MAG: PHP domain-containing protein, partial [Firmicutes bacterium]|nr:PHP domain-containing protein [Bacillota bacterium]